MQVMSLEASIKRVTRQRKLPQGKHTNTGKEIGTRKAERRFTKVTKTKQVGRGESSKQTWRPINANACGQCYESKLSCTNSFTLFRVRQAKWQSLRLGCCLNNGNTNIKKEENRMKMNTKTTTTRMMMMAMIKEPVLFGNTQIHEWMEKRIFTSLAHSSLRVCHASSLFR